MLTEGSVYKASGKVLLAGGYGVLQEGNYGLSIALNNHFYSYTQVEYSQGNNTSQIVFEVASPQIQGYWKYIYRRDKKHIQETTNQKNPFVQNAIKYAIEYCLENQHKNIEKIKIKIAFDRGFLSQSTLSETSKEKFINYEGSPSKTGLGSSACVIVVVVGGILKHLMGNITQDQVNYLSQVANIAAQNKIGSNFDISTAVYGSQLYKNILPRVAFEAIEKGDIREVMKIDPEIKRLKPNQLIVNHSCSWMLDLRRGSNTRTMVTGFIKALNSQKQEVIEQFYQSNKLFVTELYRLMCSDLVRQDLIVSIKAFNREYRRFIQNYSDYTKVPVEPPEFRGLLDDICQLEQVVYCICPGSGGYDAIVVMAIMKNEASVALIEESLEKVCLRHQVICEINRVTFQWYHVHCSQLQLQALHNYLKI